MRSCFKRGIQPLKLDQSATPDLLPLKSMFCIMAAASRKKVKVKHSDNVFKCKNWMMTSNIKVLLAAAFNSDTNLPVSELAGAA